MHCCYCQPRLLTPKDGSYQLLESKSIPTPVPNPSNVRGVAKLAWAPILAANWGEPERAAHCGTDGLVPHVVCS